MTRLALLAALLLAGCGGPTVQVIAFSERFDVEAREDFAVLVTQLEHPACWAFGEPAAVLSSLAPRYQPPGTPAGVGPASDAPAPLDALLGEAQAELEARGYRPAAPGAEPGLVVVLAHSTQGSHTTRLGLHLGGSVGEVHRPDWVSLAIEAEADDEVDPRELVRALLEVVPPRGGGEEP